MLSKKEALFRLENIAEEIGAVDKRFGISELFDKYQSSSLDELAQQIVTHDFGLKDVQWFHTEWDWLDLEWHGQFYAYFKAIMPDFNDEQPVYLVFCGSINDTDSGGDYIRPESIYTQSEWESTRQKAIEDMQLDSRLAAYLATN